MGVEVRSGLFSLTIVLMATPTFSSAQAVELPYDLRVLYNDPVQGLICSGPSGPEKCADALQYLASQLPDSESDALKDARKKADDKIQGLAQAVDSVGAKLDELSKVKPAITGVTSAPLVEERAWGFCPPPCGSK